MPKKPQIFNNFAYLLLKMINFIKQLFKKKEKIGLLLEDLEEWFDKKTRPYQKDISNKIEEIKIALNQEISKTKDNIKNLKDTELNNKKVTTTVA